jgi:hypothetical protein
LTRKISLCSDCGTVGRYGATPLGIAASVAAVASARSSTYLQALPQLCWYATSLIVRNCQTPVVNTIVIVGVVVGVEPMLTKEEFEETKRVVAEFQAAGGAGEQLQAMLQARARSTPNWVRYSFLAVV